MANPIIDSERWFGLDLFCAFQYVYLMHLMFLLSGLFVWTSLGRKGVKAFLYDRCLRLGVPFVFGVAVLMPVAYYPVYRVTAADPSWSAFWSHWTGLPFWPSGPLWFLRLLLTLNIVVAALYWLAPRSIEVLSRLSALAGAYPLRYAVTLMTVSTLAYVPLAAVFPALAMAEIRAIRLSAKFPVPLCHLFLRRCRRGRGRVRARSFGI